METLVTDQVWILLLQIKDGIFGYSSGMESLVTDHGWKLGNLLHEGRIKLNQKIGTTKGLVKDQGWKLGKYFT